MIENTAGPTDAAELPTELSRRLTRLLAASGLGQRDVIRLIRDGGGSLSPGYLSQLVSGKKERLSIDIAGRLAVALGAPKSYLATDDPHPDFEAELNRKLALRSDPELAELAEETVRLAEQREALSRHEALVHTRTASLDGSSRSDLAELVEAIMQRRRQPGPQ